MFDNNNQYNVRWMLQADTKQAFQSLAQYTSAVNAATQASLQLQRVSKGMLNGVKPGGGAGTSKGSGSIVASGQKTTQKSQSYVSGGTSQGSTQPSKSNSTSQKTSAPAGGGRGRTLVANQTGGRASGRGFQNPLRNTPFVGLMGTMLAYSAVSSEVSQAAEYANIMTTAKAILQTADSDLGTFETRFANLAKNVRQIGVETKFTAKEVADATRYLAMAGLNTDDINASMRPIANLALIADEDLGLIADLTTNIMTGYGINAQSMAPVSDVLTSVMTRSNVSITEIAESYKMSAGFLRSAGVDFNEAAAAIGVLGDAGIKATMAGTALRAMSVRFAKPTKEAVAVLDKLGVSFTEVTDVAGESVVKVRPLFEIFGDLKKSGATLEDMQKVFGTIGGNAAVNLIENADKIERLRQATLMSHGSADFIAQEKQSTVMGRWAQLTSAFSEQFTRSFESLQPQIMDVLIDITKRISSPEFGKGLHAVTSSFLQLFDIIMKGVTWIGKNMNWIQPLLMTKFIGSNVSGLLHTLTGAFSIIGGSVGSQATSNISGMLGSASAFMLSNPIGWLSAAVGLITTVALRTNQVEDANSSAFKAIIEGSPSVVNSYNKVTASINNAIRAAHDLKNMQPDGSRDYETATEATGIQLHNSDVMSNLFSWVGDAINPMNYIQLASNALAGSIESFPKYQVWGSNRHMFNIERHNTTARGAQAIALGIEDAKKISGQALQQLGSTTDIQKIKQIQAQLISGVPEQTTYGNSDIYGTDAYGQWYIKPGDGTVGYLKQTVEYQSAVASQVMTISNNLDKYTQFLQHDKPAELLKEWFPDVKALYGVLSLNEKTGKYGLPQLSAQATQEERQEYTNQLAYINSLFAPLADKKGGLSNIFGEGGAYNVLSRVFEDGVMSVTPTGSFSNMSVRDMAGPSGLGDFYGDGKGGSGKSGGLSRSNVSPKQVIINIDNMLNMENVSVNETNKGEMFNTFKQELSEALLEVVSDASASFHG